MIEINLLPGSAKKSKGRGSGLSLKGTFADAHARIRDPYMLAAVASVVVATVAIGGLHLTQSRSATSLSEREDVAVRDSTRYAAVLKERRSAEAKRDSVLRQLAIIRSIDDDRFVWPHIMDEVSRALPPYTWLKSLTVTTPQASPAQPVAAAKPDEKEAKQADRKDPVPSTVPLRFRIIGNTVD